MRCRLERADVDETASFLTIIATGAVVLVIRSAPLLLLGARRLPRHIENALHYLPAAALSALVVQMMVVKDGTLRFLTSRRHLVGAASDNSRCDPDPQYLHHRCCRDGLGCWRSVDHGVARSGLP